MSLDPHSLPHSLIDGYFDDALTEEQHAMLSDWIKSDPEHAKLFARSARLHDHLRSSLAVAPISGTADEQSVVPSTSRNASWRFLPMSIWSTAASIAVVLMGAAIFWFSSGPRAASAAFRELDRIIGSNISSKDRTYQIVVEDITTPARRGFDLKQANRPPKPPLDGATLHVREGQQFVLIRQTSDGLPFITGSNGKQSWAVNARGPVRISSDIRHFDHDLPGHETSVPLTNIRDGLERLKYSYELQFSTPGPEEYEAQGGENVRLLMAVKKPRERGPQRVEIAYDFNTGRILHMRFVQMPYGPERLDVRLSLLNENELPLDYFEHTSHHAPDRKIELEN